MKALYLSAALLLASGTFASAQCKLDGRALSLIESNNPSDPDAPVGRAAADPDRVTSVLVTLEDGYTTDDITAAGFEVTFERAGMAFVHVPVSKLYDLASLDAVRHIAGNSQLRPTNDRAREAIELTPVITGTSEALGRAYTGKGVVTGIVDKGIDPNHANFRNEDGSLRVKEFYTWVNWGTSIKSYIGDSEISGVTTDDRTLDHGTHTLGIMAGSYKGLGEYNYMSRDIAVTDKYTADNPAPIPYYGIATESDIIASGVDLYDEYIVKGIDNAVKYGQRNNMPVVVNMSLGMNYGPHDNSTALNRMISSYKDDAIMVVSAGNEGDKKIATYGKFDNNKTQYGTLLRSENGKTIKYEGSFWCSDNTVFTLEPCIVDGTTGEVIGSVPFNTNTEGQVVWFNGTFYGKDKGEQYNPCEAVDRAFTNRSYIKMATNIDTSNNRYNVQVSVNMTRSSSADENLQLGYIIKAPAGKEVFGYISSNNDTSFTPAFFDNYGLDGWTDGSCNGTINDMACADGLIVVGAYNTRRSWASLAGQKFTNDGMFKGEVCYFSSYGTILGGTNLPHVIAPGGGIISSSNRYFIETYMGANKRDLAAKATAFGRENYYECESGTSMAAPMVAGVVALMLEAKPTLKVDEARDILIKTASKEKVANADRVDPVSYGAGLINAHEALKELLGLNSVGNIMDDPEDQLLINRNGNLFNIFVAGATSLDVDLYNMAGVSVAGLNVSSNEADLDVNGVRPGVYILNVKADNGTYNKRVLIK